MTSPIARGSPWKVLPPVESKTKMDSFVGTTGGTFSPATVSEFTGGRLVSVRSSSSAVRKNVSPSLSTSYCTVAKVATPPDAVTLTPPDRAPPPTTGDAVSVTSSRKSISTTERASTALISG